MGEMRDSDWSRPKILRSDWSVPKGATYTTNLGTAVTVGEAGGGGGLCRDSKEVRYI